MARITIVDDDVEVAENMAGLLRQNGHEVAVLHTTQDAAQKVAQNKPSLAILDVMFPDNPAGGFDLARQIRRAKATRSLPIMLLTAVNQQFPMNFSAKDIDQEWMPVQDFMEKPIDTKVFLDKVNRLLKPR